MPNYYAHSLFGQRVRDLVRPEVQAAIDRQWEGYACGQYGPDPLFFHCLGVPTPVNQQGHRLHYLEPVDSLERLRKPIQAGKTYALGYALGFLCHFLLDSSCHPYVRAVSDRKEISHLALEGEFDRYLMQTTGYTPHKHTPLERPEDPAVFAAAALAYEGVKPGQFRRGMKGYYFICRLLTRFQGSLFCPVVDAATKPVKNSHRVLLRKHPAKASLVTTPEMMAQFEAAIPPAAALVEQLYDAYRQDLPLDFLPKVNFQGERMD